MDVGAALLARARALGASSLAVVGTSKNAGKTVTIAALCAALEREGTPFGLCSIGRDGEAADALDGTPKPRLFLRAGTLVATAAALVPRHPAAEIVAFSDESSALGPIVFARVRGAGRFEIAGPPQAAALRRVAARFPEFGARFVLIDGASTGSPPCATARTRSWSQPARPARPNWPTPSTMRPRWWRACACRERIRTAKS